MRFEFKTGRRLLAVCLVSACSLLGAPVSSDLWDSSQAGFTNLTVSPGLQCGAASNLFGTALGGTSCATGVIEGLAGGVILQEVGGAVTTFQWDTAAMNLTSFGLGYGGESVTSRLLDRSPIERLEWIGICTVL